MYTQVKSSQVSAMQQARQAFGPMQMTTSPKFSLVCVTDKNCEEGMDANGNASKLPALLQNRDDSNKCNVIA